MAEWLGVLGAGPNLKSCTSSFCNSVIPFFHSYFNSCSKCSNEICLLLCNYHIISHQSYITERDNIVENWILFIHSSCRFLESVILAEGVNDQTGWTRARLQGALRCFIDRVLLLLRQSFGPKPTRLSSDSRPGLSQSSPSSRNVRINNPLSVFM